MCFRHLVTVRDSHLKERILLSRGMCGKLGCLQWRFQLSVRIEEGAQGPNAGAKVGLHTYLGTQPF